MNNSECEWDGIARKKLMGDSKQYRDLPCLVRLLRSFQLSESSRIADFGCYNAQDIIMLAKSAKGLFFGYDIARSAIEAGRKAVLQANIGDRVSLFHRDIEDLSLVPDKFFEVSIAKYVIQFLSAPRQFLLGVKRITSKGIIIAVPVVETLDNPELTDRAKRISMERNVLYAHMNAVFGSAFQIEEMISDTTDEKCTIEILSAKVG